MNERICAVVPSGHFRNVFIVESRDEWVRGLSHYDPSLDLVLTYDFGLRRDIEALGGIARYVDHVCDQAVMQENNFLMYQFFRDWHRDEEGNDIFRHREVDFGFSFRIEIWNDYTFYVRTRLCLEQLRNIDYEILFVGSNQTLIAEVLGDMGLSFCRLEPAVPPACGKYFFPIHQWMDERLRIRRLRHLVRDMVIATQGIVMSAFDWLTDFVFPKKRVFVQEYYPTRQLLHALQRQPGVRVVLGHFSAGSNPRKIWSERPIPIYGRLKKKRLDADRLIDAFRKRRHARLILSMGLDVTDAAYRIIERRIAEVLPGSLRSLECVIRYLNRHPICLEILIANIGQVAMIVDCVAKSRDVPSYMIINGLLGNEYLDEAKYATVINSYSTSIRDHYFRGMDNIVCLGDPRMDSYALAMPRAINRKNTTITIGASGFSNIDLNSYLAVEFEFLHEVLTAIANQSSQGQIFRVILKVRANGYSGLYRQFVDEYFPGCVERIEDQIPMRDVLDQTDLFITIYSQTLFEASCLGIPCVYHKNDREVIDPPFDGKSELVTTRNVQELEQAIADFLSENSRFSAFLKRETMEKYVGPLDGKNLERNLSFVEELLNQSGSGR